MAKKFIPRPKMSALHRRELRTLPILTRKELHEKYRALWAAAEKGPGLDRAVSVVEDEILRRARGEGDE